MNTNQAIKDSSYPPLQNQELTSAVNDLTSCYPKVLRSDDDPKVTEQNYGLTSCMFFDTPKTMKDGSVVYGFMKNRGNFATEESAKRTATDLVRNVDSVNTIKIGLVGRWLPICNGNADSAAVEEVYASSDPHLEHLEKQKTKKKEEAEIIKEIKQREEELKKEDIYDNEWGAPYYVMKRVTERKLCETIRDLTKKIDEYRKSVRDTREKLATIEHHFPNHKRVWLNIYNAELRKAGIPDIEIPQEELDEYEANIIDLLNGGFDPSENSPTHEDVSKNSVNIKEHSIAFVMEETDSSREKATEALIYFNGDIISAVNKLKK